MGAAIYIDGVKVGGTPAVSDAVVTIMSGTVSCGTFSLNQGTDATIVIPENTPAAPSWGGITGTLSSQTDLQTALDAKVSDAFISGSTVSLKDQQGNVSIPIASSNTIGVSKTNTSLGTDIAASGNASGAMMVSPARKLELNARYALDIPNQLNGNCRMPVVPATIDYAVKAAMTDGVGTAWTDAERLAGTQRMRSTATLTGSTVTIASLLPNCDYVCSDPVEQLTITGSTASNIDTSITFTAGTSCSVSLPADMDDTNFTPPEANKRCYMGVVNGAAFSVIGGTATSGE